MTTSARVEGDPFLALIDARLAALQQLRASYLAAKAAGAIGQGGEALPSIPAARPLPAEALPSEPPGDSADLAEPLAAGPPSSPDEPVAVAPARPPMDDGRKRGRGIGDAVRQCLASATAPQSVRDIARALRLQGVVSKAASMEATIASALHRLKQQGATIRTRRGWLPGGPDAAARAAAFDAAPDRAPRIVGRRPPRPRRAVAETPADRQEGGLAWRIESLLKSHGQPVAARYVASATGAPVNVVGLALGRMVKQQRVEKQSDGRFAVVVPISGASDGPSADAAEPTQA
jgi:hypothetical protein